MRKIMLKAEDRIFKNLYNDLGWEIYYANTREDAKKIDFDDSFIYLEIPKKIGDRKIKMIQMLRDDALKAFEIWDKKLDKIKY